MTLVPTSPPRRDRAPVAHGSGRCVVPGAVSPLLADLVEGAGTTTTVLAALPAALYLAADPLDGPARPRVLPVVTHDAVLLPTALVIGRDSGRVDWGVGPGDSVRVSAGRVELPALTVASVRRRRPPRVLPSPARRAPVVPHGGAPALAGAAEDLVGRALAGEDPAPAVAILVGRGRGLTPSGDDALCGVLLGLRAVAGPAARAARLAVAAALTPLLPRTTALSASLLLAAAQGYAAPQVVRLVSAAVAGDAGGVARTLPDVLRIGHSSGGDLVAGLRGTLRALTPDLPPTAPDLLGVHP